MAPRRWCRSVLTVAVLSARIGGTPRRLTLSALAIVAAKGATTCDPYATGVYDRSGIMGRLGCNYGAGTPRDPPTGRSPVTGATSLCSTSGAPGMACPGSPWFTNRRAPTITRDPPAPL